MLLIKNNREKNFQHNFPEYYIIQKTVLMKKKHCVVKFKIPLLRYNEKSCLYRTNM